MLYIDEWFAISLLLCVNRSATKSAEQRLRPDLCSAFVTPLQSDCCDEVVAQEMIHLLTHSDCYCLTNGEKNVMTFEVRENDRLGNTLLKTVRDLQ